MSSPANMPQVRPEPEPVVFKPRTLPDPNGAYNHTCPETGCFTVVPNHLTTCADHGSEYVA